VVDVAAVLAVNREQGWAVVSGGGRARLPLASPDAIKVGDRCYSIESSPAGGRGLAGCTVNGRIPGSQGNTGFVVRFATGPGTLGAPVVNEYGELLGLVGGSGAPAAPFRVGDAARADLPDALLIPGSSIRIVAGAAPQGIPALQASGVLIAPLAGDEHVVSGGFARRPVKTNTVPPADQRESFSPADKTFVVFVNWLPTERLKGTSKLRLYDASNRLLGESQPGKADLRKGQLSLSSWQLPVPADAGPYRAEVLLNDKPVWRGTLRVTP
jgi:hypothetical protein